MIAVKNGEKPGFGGNDAWDHVFLCHQIAETHDVGGKELGTAAWDRNEALFYYLLLLYIYHDNLRKTACLERDRPA